MFNGQVITHHHRAVARQRHLQPHQQRPERHPFRVEPLLHAFAHFGALLHAQQRALRQRIERAAARDGLHQTGEAFAPVLVGALVVAAEVEEPGQPLDARQIASDALRVVLSARHHLGDDRQPFVKIDQCQRTQQCIDAAFQRAVVERDIGGIDLTKNRQIGGQLVVEKAARLGRRREAVEQGAVEGLIEARALGGPRAPAGNEALHAARAELGFHFVPAVEV